MLKKIIAAVVVLAVFALVAAALFVWLRPMTVFAWMNRRALVSAGFKKVAVETGTGRQTMFVAGQGPALIFLHGAGDQAGSWSKTAAAFSNTHRVVVPDLPGHGESAPAKGPLDMARVYAGAEAVIDKEACPTAAATAGCVPKPVTIVGNSLGAWVAMLYAHKHPERVERMVLVNGGALMGNRPDLTLMPTNREQARRLFQNLMDPGSPAIPDFVLDDIVRESHNGPIARMSLTAATMPFFLLEGHLQEVTTPVDLLWGEADKLFSLDYAHRLEAGLPAVRLTTLPRCGHVPQQECPIAFRGALKIILQQPVPERKAATGISAAK